eukprot:365932-Chlamydomonas_euryale.AAC.4
MCHNVQCRGQSESTGQQRRGVVEGTCQRLGLGVALALALGCRGVGFVVVLGSGTAVAIADHNFGPAKPVIASMGVRRLGLLRDSTIYWPRPRCAN